MSKRMLSSTGRQCRDTNLIMMGTVFQFFFRDPKKWFVSLFPANIGSGAVPGRLPGGRFREVPGRFGAGSEPRSGKVPGQVPIHEFRERGRFRTTGFGAGFGGQGSAGTVPERFWPGF